MTLNRPNTIPLLESVASVLDFRPWMALNQAKATCSLPFSDFYIHFTLHSMMKHAQVLFKVSEGGHSFTVESARSQHA